MAAVKSLISLFSSQSAALLLLVVLATVHTHTANSQRCTNQLSNLNVCAPFILPGARTTAAPNAECCHAIHSMQHDCLCNTVRIAAQLPSQCNLPTFNCDVEARA